MFSITQNSLAVVAMITIAAFMYFILSKRLSPLTALILIPSIVGICIAPNLNTLSDWMKAGLLNVAKPAMMLTFAILYFSLMLDCGLFEPLIKKILQFVKNDPVRIAVGTAVLSLLISLDGDGATTYLIVVGAFLPLYKATGMNPLKLTAIAILAGGVMNILPWGGPTARVITSLKLNIGQVFVPMIICMVAGAIWVLAVAYWFGLSERKRLGVIHLEMIAKETNSMALNIHFWANLLLTVILMVLLVSGISDIAPLFMIAFAFALMINYSKLDDQRLRINAYAGNVLQVTLMIFASGIFTGIGNESGMLNALGNVFAGLVPSTLGRNLPLITALSSMPFTFFMENNSFYFGLLPTLSATAANFGIDSAEMARASLLGQPVHLLSPLVPSTYLLVGLAGVSFSDHLRHTLKWAIGTVVVMLIVALLVKVILIR